VWLSKQKIFFVTIFILFSLPFTTAFTTNLLDERHSIINNYVIVETDNPDFEISLYGLDNDRVVNQKIYELQSEIVYYDVASEKEIVCKTIIEDLNGDIHKCYETIYTEESKTIESWVELSKPTKEIEFVSYAEREVRILEDSKLSSLKTVISVDSIKLDDSKLITYKVTWETPLGKEEWGSSGEWSINPTGWWDSDYTTRYPIDISLTHTEITTDTTLFLNNIDSSGFECTNNLEYSIVYTNGVTVTELDAYTVNGLCGTNDLNIAFKSQVNIPENTAFNSTDSNGYYIYLTATGTSTKRDRRNVYSDFDGFENGNYTSNPTWTNVFKIPIVSNVVKREGIYSLALTTRGVSHSLYTDFNNSSSDVSVVSFWYQGNQDYIHPGLSLSLNSDNNTLTQFNFSGDSSSIYGNTSTTNVELQDSIAVDTWYKGLIKYYKNEEKVDYYLYADNNSLISSSLNNIPYDINSITRVSIGGNDENSYVDNVTWWNENSIITLSLGIDIEANFSSSGSNWLDTEEGITSLSWVFTNTSNPIDANFTWFVNSASQGTNVNLNYNFTSTGDYNVFLQMDSAGTLYTAQEWVSIGELPQGLAITPTSATKDVNTVYTLTWTNDVNTFYIDWAGDSNSIITNNPTSPNATLGHTFTTTGTKTINITAQINDQNKTVSKIVYVVDINFSVFGSSVLDPSIGVNSVTRDFNNTSIYSSPPIPTWSWLVNSVQKSTDINYTHSFTSVGDYNISLIMDYNSTIIQKDINITIGTFPEIVSTDYNYSSSFSITAPINFGNLSMKCTYFDTDANLTYNFQLNDVNVANGVYDVNATGYAVDLNFVDGLNTIVYSCSTDVNSTVTETVTFNVAIKNFYFVYDKTGVSLASSTEYTLADVNNVVVYKLGDSNIFYDLVANNQVGIYYVGDSNSALGWRISYNDITLVTTSRTFDLDVLDVNSVPVCFYKLQPYFEQLLYSSVERDIKIKNASNGCYHVAATTKYAANDFFSLYAYTVPLSYYLFINDNTAGNLTINLEGGTSGTINLDAIVLKNQLSTNIVITGDSATVTKNCGTSSDCNTFIITYRNLATNNSSVKFTLFNGTTTLLTYTESTTPDNFTYIFDATTLDFNATVLTLRLEKTRTDGSTDIETIYFTPEGDVGFLDPTLVLIFSFLLFIGGITLATARFTFGWFGIVIGFMALVLLSFAVGFWWITFMQGIMMIMLIYMGIVSVKQEGVF